MQDAVLDRTQGVIEVRAFCGSRVARRTPIRNFPQVAEQALQFPRVHDLTLLVIDGRAWAPVGAMPCNGVATFAERAPIAPL